MRNKLSDLNNILFEQLERLMDDDADPNQFELEKQRSKLVANIANAIVNNARLQLDAAKHASEWNGTDNAHMSAALLGEADE